jgi:hypothetical protein
MNTTRTYTSIIAAVVVALTVAVPAQASKGRKLSAHQVSAAVNGFASSMGREMETLYTTEKGSKVSLQSSSVTQCRRYLGGGICHVQWVFSDRTCAQTVGALPEVAPTPSAPKENYDVAPPE